jgi:hypothetical protein
MDHQLTARTLVSTVIVIGITEVEGEMIVAPRVHPGCVDAIEPLGTLAISFFHLGAEATGVMTYGVSPEKFVPVILGFEPHFQFFGLFEYTDEKRTPEGEALGVQALHDTTIGALERHDGLVAARQLSSPSIAG